jgi:hypothetical protein
MESLIYTPLLEDLFRTALDKAPGPSPWYLQDGPVAFESSHPLLSWRAPVDNGEHLAGTHLVTAAGDVLLIVGHYCYLASLGLDRLLIWWNAFHNGLIKMYILDLKILAPIPESVGPTRALRTAPDPVYFNGPSVAESVVGAFTEPGHHSLSLPPAFSEVDEILVLAQFARTNAASHHLAAYSLRPALGQMAVYPQDWFNQSDYDFGYQWVSKLTREPRTKRLCGKGVRIRDFVLDSTNRQVDHWLGRQER